jgi:AraC-like DNA-binding protein
MSARPSTRFWMPAALPGVSCLTATFTEQRFPPHVHDALVIAVTESGGACYSSRGRSDEATAERLLVFNPAEPHWGHMGSSRHWRYRAWYLDARALAVIEGQTGSRTPGFTANAVADPDLIAAFVRAHRELERGDGSRAREQLVEACGTLFARWGCGDTPLLRTGSGDRAIVDRALATIHARSRDGVTLDTLADAAGVSPFQLIRLFRRFTGMPPHAHLVRARLHDALRRIRRGAVLAEAALAAGFFDQPAMTRAFRRAYGITPGQYRDAVRAGR